MLLMKNNYMLLYKIHLKMFQSENFWKFKLLEGYLKTSLILNEKNKSKKTPHVLNCSVFLSCFFIDQYLCLLHPLFYLCPLLLPLSLHAYFSLYTLPDIHITYFTRLDILQRSQEKQSGVTGFSLQSWPQGLPGQKTDFGNLYAFWSLTIVLESMGI